MGTNRSPRYEPSAAAEDAEKPAADRRKRVRARKTTGVGKTEDLGGGLGLTSRVRLPIGDVIANPKNPRVHPEEQLERLTQAIVTFGQVRPILVRTANHMIIGGHGVWEACKRAGRTEIEVELWDTDQETADQFMVADNRHGQLAYDDAAAIAEILRGCEPDNYLALGFDADEVDKLLGDLERSEVKVEELDTSPVDDRFWIAVRGPLAQQPYALRRLQELMAELPQVDVELGTTGGGS